MVLSSNVQPLENYSLPSYIGKYKYDISSGRKLYSRLIITVFDESSPKTRIVEIASTI